MVGVPAAELNHIFTGLHLVLADRARLARLLGLAVVELLDLLLAEPLRDLSDLVAEVEQLLSAGKRTS